ncbi:maleylpyruvate isomerase family mycothiol-dependent enzyme [Catenulispora sp. NF23]|uniref:Maleylpyruvate isomerase family mycothiol-dependent enzyme n=1 Tax=Catenulispora pinistramenti TaxID=2705254 RepID=A0ABS5KU77_9ACTN|nr:maleylpyruvate isomerase family mycothiol-dependent enzyme [Catenulispora pinistramenti]MBS2538164.1 maleylpyruvate isomerase family mycothiol-dependent enzyme [Catenulispora pinistramenti]MBS2549598.1 maleylpyruvate isomerase family mycothiol-dependent enzyme [Catenulispora pinistramenti]
MTTAGVHYRVIRSQLTELAEGLTAEQAGTAVPALPGWSVKDTYAHLAGISYNFVTGAMAYPDDPAWTAEHVAARRNRSLAEICAEWTANSATAEAVLDDPAGRRTVFAVFDAFHHGHDIRGALGRREARDTPETAFVATLMTKFKRGGWAQGGHPPVQLACAAGSWRLGPADGEPVAALTTSDFELSRIIVGRRSRAQMLAAGWSGDPEPIVDLLPVFGPPVTDLTE